MLGYVLLALLVLMFLLRFGAPGVVVILVLSGFGVGASALWQLLTPRPPGERR